MGGEWVYHCPFCCCCYYTKGSLFIRAYAGDPLSFFLAFPGVFVMAKPSGRFFLLESL